MQGREFTEEVCGVDIVKAMLRIAMRGATLADVLGGGGGQEMVPAPRGFAIQCRVNMETMKLLETIVTVKVPSEIATDSPRLARVCRVRERSARGVCCDCLFSVIAWVCARVCDLVVRVDARLKLRCFGCVHPHSLGRVGYCRRKIPIDAIPWERSPSQSGSVAYRRQASAKNE